MTAGSWFLYVRTDELLFGPYGSEEACERAARVFYDDADDYERADMNADFAVLRLSGPAEPRRVQT